MSSSYNAQEVTVLELTHYMGKYTGRVLDGWIVRNRGKGRARMTFRKQDLFGAETKSAGDSSQ